MIKLLLNPYVLLGALLALLGAGAAGYRLGHANASGACAQDKADALVRAFEQADAIALQDAEVLATYEHTRERLRTVFVPIREGVTRYVQDHAGAAAECLDADGMRLWRAANAGPAEAPAAGEPDYRLAGSAAATLGTRAGSAGQPRAVGAAVPRVPGYPSGAGGLDAQ